jgi:hypothetical protein
MVETASKGDLKKIKKSRDQKASRLQSIKQQSPELNVSVDEQHYHGKNIDLQNVSQQNQSIMSHNNNPFTGPLPSQERTLEDQKSLQSDKINNIINFELEKPALRHPDHLNSVEVKNNNTAAANSTEFASSFDVHSPL